jgi:hypothetical protein
MRIQNETLLEAYAACPPSARIAYTLESCQSPFAEPARRRECRYHMVLVIGPLAATSAFIAGMG